MKKVLVGMSGGIDSSVAAALLKEQGYEVEGVTMLIWKKDSKYPEPVSPNSCYNPDKTKDLEKIEQVCSALKIKHRVIDCSDLYEAKVLENFRAEYISARTPNPCIWCNTLIKFGYLVDKAREETDFDYFATGHYARIAKRNGRFCLLKAVDQKKDQSYFLSRLSQDQLSHILFPLGEYRKDDIRKIDVSYGFHEEGERESQDFYGGDYSDLIGLENKKGSIVFTDGRVLAEHDGYWHYTIGQRKGLKIAYSEPLYVVDIDSVTNTVVVGTVENTFKSRAEVRNVNYVSSLDFDEDVYSVKIRSASAGIDAHVEKTDDGFFLTFLSPAKALTPGQSAVVYSGDAVIASGIIEKAY